MANKFDPPSGAPPAYQTQSPAPSHGTPYPQPVHLQSPAPSTDYYGASNHGSPYPPNAKPYGGPPQADYYAGQQPYYGPNGPYQQGPGPQGPGGYYQQQPMGYGPQYGPQSGYRPQGQYVDERRSGSNGLIGALIASLACCCCLDCIF